MVDNVVGDDWSIPSWARMTAGAGLISWATEDKGHGEWLNRMAELPRYGEGGGMHLAGICYVQWSSVNPREGKFDFSAVDRVIERYCSKPGVGFTFWLAVYNRDVVPKWLLEKPGMYVLPDSTLPAWRDDCPYQKYLREMLFALAERYGDDPRLLAVELRGLDRQWGEMYYHGNLKEAQRDHGFTPDAFERWAKRYIDDAVEAFRGQSGRLVWLRHGGPHTPNYFHATLNPEFLEASRAVTRYAYQKGLARRDGGVEVWTWYTWNAELYGQRVTDDGYLEVIEDFAPLHEGRLWYTENEIVENAPYLWPDSESFRMWPILCLRALQMRCNWVWINSNFYERFDHQRPGLNRWFELSLGKTAPTSPDAWSWLREGYVWGHDERRWGLHTVRNFERWLFQRDVEGDGRTANAEWFDVTGYGQWIREWYFGRKGGEWHARRTQLAEGQRCIYFRADRAFLAGGPHDVLVKVTYLDGEENTWRLEYEGPGGKAKSPEIRTQQSGRWRTATFRVPWMRFANGFSGNMDFRLVTDGPADLTVRFVRVVRTADPGEARRTARK